MNPTSKTCSCSVHMMLHSIARMGELPFQGSSLLSNIFTFCKCDVEPLSNIVADNSGRVVLVQSGIHELTNLKYAFCLHIVLQVNLFVCKCA